MEGCGRGVLAHDPGVRVANFFDGIRGQVQKLRIPARCAGVLAGHAFTELDEGVLDVAGVLGIVQIFGDLRVGEMAAEPGAPPKQEGHEDNQPGGEEEKQSVARGHAMVWARRPCRRILGEQSWIGGC